MIFGRWGKCSITRFIGDCSPDFSRSNLRSSPAGCPSWWCWWSWSLWSWWRWGEWWWWSSLWRLLARLLMIEVILGWFCLRLYLIYHFFTTFSSLFYLSIIFIRSFFTIFHHSQEITFLSFSSILYFITYLFSAIKWVSQMWKANICVINIFISVLILISNHHHDHHKQLCK